MEEAYLQVKQPYLDCLTLVLVRLFLAASIGDDIFKTEEEK